MSLGIYESGVFNMNFLKSFAFVTIFLVSIACSPLGVQRTEPIIPQSIAPLTGNPNLNPNTSATPPILGHPQTPSTTPTPTIAPLPVTPVSGISCTSSDPNKICLGVKVIVFKNSQGVAVVDSSKMEAAIAQANTVWSFCNIGFQMEQFSPIDPSAYGLTYDISDSLTFLYDFVNRFKTINQLIFGISGPWSEIHLGWTFISPGDPLGLVLNPKEVSRPYTLAHEIGHYIGLSHYGNSQNVMSSTDNGGIQILEQIQCQTARANIPTALGPALRHL